MRTLGRLLRSFAADDDGTTAIEYGLIAALIAMALIGGMTAFGTGVTDMFGYVRDTAGAAMDNAGG